MSAWSLGQGQCQAKVRAAPLRAAGPMHALFVVARMAEDDRAVALSLMHHPYLHTVAQLIKDTVSRFD